MKNIDEIKEDIHSLLKDSKTTTINRIKNFFNSELQNKVYLTLDSKDIPYKFTFINSKGNRIKIQPVNKCIYFYDKIDSYEKNLIEYDITSDELKNKVNIVYNDCKTKGDVSFINLIIKILY